MAHRISSWTQHWGQRPVGPPEGQEFLKLQEKVIGLEVDNPITLEQVREAIKASKSNTVPGYDQWKPADNKRLPLEGLQDITAILNHIEDTKSWPLQVLLNLVAFLGKPGETFAERPITLTAGLYRVYCQVRRDEIRSWGNTHSGFWDKAVRGVRV